MGANIMGAVLSVLYAARNGLMDCEVRCKTAGPSTPIKWRSYYHYPVSDVRSDDTAVAARKRKPEPGCLITADRNGAQCSFLLRGSSAIHNFGARTITSLLQVWGAAEINLGYELSEDHKRVLLLVLKVGQIVSRGRTPLFLLSPESQESSTLELSRPGRHQTPLQHVVVRADVGLLAL